MPRKVVFHMGFINTPYSAKTLAAPMAAAKSEVARKQRRGFTKTMTANRVAGILEHKYNITEMFQEIHREDIESILHESFGDVMMDHLLSERRGFSSERMVRYMKPKTDRIDKLFRSFLDRDEMYEAGSIKAVSGKKRRTKRAGPPFVDTGIYRASFRSWVDIK